MIRTLLLRAVMIASALVATQFRFSKPSSRCSSEQCNSERIMNGDLEEGANSKDEQADSGESGTLHLLSGDVRGQSSPPRSTKSGDNELSERCRLPTTKDEAETRCSIEGRDSDNLTAMLRADSGDRRQSLSSGQGYKVESDPQEVQPLKTPAETSKSSSSRRSYPATGLAAAFRKPSVVSFFLIMILMGVAMGTIDGFLPLRLTELGGDPTVIGLALTVTCVAEVPLMWVSGRLIKSLGVLGVLYLALACYVARFAYYSMLREPWAVLPIELLHGVTFGCGWTAGTVHSGRIAPPGLEATMQALFSGAYFGIGTSFGMLGGGFIYEHFGSVVLFRWAGLVTAVGALVFALSQRWCPLEGQKDEELSQSGEEEYTAVPLKELTQSGEE